MVSIILVILALLAPISAEATRYWVSTTGSDSNSCAAISGDNDPGTYKLTPNSAEDCATSPGDIVTFKAGVYSGTDARIRPVAAGTAGNPIIFEGDPGDAEGCAIAQTCSVEFRSVTNNSIINRSYITVRKIWFNNINNRVNYPLRVGDGTQPCTGVRIEDVELSSELIASNGASGLFIWPTCSGGTVVRLHTHDNGQIGDIDHGIYAQGDDWTFRNIWSHDNASLGMQCFVSSSTSDGRADRCKVYDSLFEDNASGVALEGHDDEFIGNIVRNNAGSGVLLGYGGCERAKLYNNTIYNNGTRGIRFGMSSANCAGSEVKNSIVVGNPTAAIEVLVGSVTQTHNACSSSQSCGSTGKVAVSSLTDIVLSATTPTVIAGSDVIDAGTDVGYSYNGSAPDIGALETFTFSACEVPEGAATTIRATFINNRHPPLLPASSITGVTARKATVSNTITASARVGDNQIDFTTTNSYGGADAADISATTTNITDSALIGYTFNQPWLGTLSNQSCTNNIGGVSYTLTQAAYELHDAFGTEASPVMRPHGFASTGAAENFTTLNVRQSGSLRLRFAIVCGGADCPDTAFSLRYALDGGSYTAIPDAFDSDNIAFCGTTITYGPSNGAPTTEQLSTSGTFTTGGVVFTANAVPTVTGFTNGKKTEIEYCVTFDSDATGTYTFRIYTNAGNALDTYSNTPQVIITTPAAGGAGF